MYDLAVTIGNLGNLGNEQYLEPCLRSVYAEDAPGFGYSVLIASNGFDDDGLMRHIAETFPQAQLIYRRDKLGYTGTYNLLMQASNAGYVLILGDDTVAPKGILPAVVRFMDEHPEVGIAGCKTLNPDGSFLWSYGVTFKLRTEMRNAFRLAGFWPEHIYRNIDGWKTVAWLNGSFMLVRTETLAAVGGLDDYYTFLSEADWCLRIGRAGWKVASVPDVAIIHIGGLHSVNSQVKPYDALIRSHINRYYFFHKHYGSLQLALLRPVMTPGRHAEARQVQRALHVLAGPSPGSTPQDTCVREGDRARLCTVSLALAAQAAAPKRTRERRFVRLGGRQIIVEGNAFRLEVRPWCPTPMTLATWRTASVSWTTRSASDQRPRAGQTLFLRRRSAPNTGDLP